MNEQKPERVYVRGIYIREHVFPNGGSILNATIEMDDLLEFADKYAHEGKVRLIIERKREPQPGGTTHSARLDPWKPSGQPRQEQQRPVARQAPLPIKPKQAPLKMDSDDGEGSVPF